MIIYIHEKHTLWVDYLHLAVDWLNNATHYASLRTPNYLQNETSSKEFWDKLINIKKIRQEHNFEIVDYKLICEKVKE